MWGAYPQENKVSDKVSEYSKYLGLCLRGIGFLCFQALPSRQTTIENRTKGNEAQVVKLQGSSSSPRSISIVQLNTLLYLHLRPIKLVVYK